MRKVLLSAATLFMSMLFGVSAYAADIDKTDKVGTSKEAWNAAGGPVTIDGISMPEKYETTTATLGDVMWQTVEGLDNGTYTVELWANARYTAGRGFESAATDGQLECTFLYANNVEISIPVVFNPDLNNNTSHVLEGVEVTDGTLKMGMTKKADGSNWHTIQIKALTLHATDDAALASAKAELQAAIDAAAAVSPAIASIAADRDADCPFAFSTCVVASSISSSVCVKLPSGISAMCFPSFFKSQAAQLQFSALSNPSDTFLCCPAPKS